MSYLIIYKTIPIQFAFYIHKDGTLQITQVTKVEREMKFKSEKEARDYVNNIKIQL